MFVNLLRAWCMSPYLCSKSPSCQKSSGLSTEHSLANAFRKENAGESDRGRTGIPNIKLNNHIARGKHSVLSVSSQSLYVFPEKKDFKFYNFILIPKMVNFVVVENGMNFYVFPEKKDFNFYNFILIPDMVNFVVVENGMDFKCLS